VLVSQRVAGSVESFVELEPAKVLTLKGFHRPVHARVALELRDSPAN